MLYAYIVMYVSYYSIKMENKCCLCHLESQWVTPLTLFYSQITVVNIAFKCCAAWDLLILFIFCVFL